MKIKSSEQEFRQEFRNKKAELFIFHENQSFTEQEFKSSRVQRFHETAKHTILSLEGHLVNSVISMNNKPEPPNLPAYDTGKSLAIWCVHCRDWHYHGRGYDDDLAYGHRNAHCLNRMNSPYKATGYVLMDAGKATDTMIKDMRRGRSLGPGMTGV